MILEFIASIFTGIGIAVALVHTTRGGFQLAEKVIAASKRKHEREDRIIATLKQIDERLNQLKP